MDRFIAYIKNTLHIDANESKYEQSDRLPLYLRIGYNLSLFSINGIEFLLAQPKEQSNLTTLRKQVVQLKNLADTDCVLCLESVRIYTKEKMLSEGIPFVIAGQQIYMPFLGIALSNNYVREIPPIERLSISTQKLLLTAIYQDWKHKTLTETAKSLEMSKMSMTRSFDELQALGLNLIKSMGKSRYFTLNGSHRDLWDTIQPYLRNPVAKRYMFGEHVDITSKKLSGFSAVCHYSMLTDSPYKVVAVSKGVDKVLGLNALPQIPDGEIPDMIVHVMLYDLKYQDGAAVDPLTAILTLSEEDKNDPRVEIAIKKILKLCLYD